MDSGRPKPPARRGRAQATAGRLPLTREAVVREALRLIDERGLDALSMRSLGASLGVRAMSLYKHVPSKAALLDGVVELMLEELGSVAGRDRPWRESMAAFARGYRAIALRHPEAFRLFVQRPETGYVSARAMAQEGLVRLRAAGFSETDAILVLRTVTRFVIGFCLSAPSPTRERDVALAEAEGGTPLADRLVGALSDDDGSLFEFGLGALLRGMEPSAA